MPDLEIQIGGRAFHVACQPGEEHFLRTAAGLLDGEAQPLIAQMGRLPEGRMLLMAGLMLADKMAAMEDEVKSLRARLASGEAGAAAVPVDLSGLSELVARAEAMAAQAEARQA
jgi:cell division protein ZapA